MSRPRISLPMETGLSFVSLLAMGPSEGTRKSVDSLLGKTVVPIAIVLVYADSVDDDSLRELVNCEERELLMQVIPAAIVDQLPLLLDIDPNLVNKIADLIQRTVTQITCSKVR